MVTRTNGVPILTLRGGQRVTYRFVDEHRRFWPVRMICRALSVSPSGYDARLTPSISRKGNCLDNAPMESFLHTLKVERAHHRVYATCDEVRCDLFAYIEGFYNSRRLHSGIGYHSQADMERMAA